jgi:hypothetical protein
MATLTLRGQPRYIKYMKDHLEQEHPTTRGKLRMRS